MMRRFFRFLWHLVPFHGRLRSGMTILLMWLCQGVVLLRLRRYKIIYPAAGLGDLVMIVNSILAYKKLHPKARVAIVLSQRDQTQMGLLRLIGNEIDRIACIWTLPTRVCYYRSVDRSRLMVRLLPYSDYAEENFAKLIDGNLSYPYMCRSGCVLTSSLVEGFFFGENGLCAGKTVLLCPAATSCENDDDDLWLKIACQLSRSGFTPVFNSNKADRYKEWQSVFLDIADTIAFADKCGFVVSTRSGLCDVLGFCSTSRLLVLWPDAQAAWSEIVRNRWLRADGSFDHDSFMKAWSVERIFPRKGICELVQSQETAAEEIVELLLREEKLV